jgi:hypothetical protein
MENAIMEKSEIQALIDSIGIEYNAEFVPQWKSRNAGEKSPSLNWTVTIKKGNQSLSTDYMQGIGHLKNYQHGNRLVWYVDAVKLAANTGKWNPNIKYETQHFTKDIPKPELIDVLYSLVLDSDVINHPSFEDWANEFGYDVDSRKAEKTYRECMQIALKLRAMLGNDNLEKLREAFQDY